MLQVNRWINVVSAAVQKSMFIPVSKSTVDSRQREWLIGLVVVHFWNGKINYDYYDHPYSA